jgi:hypothetical protein
MPRGATAVGSRWERMLDEGVYATVSEIGDAENISKSYVSRILRLVSIGAGTGPRIGVQSEPLGP